MNAAPPVDAKALADRIDRMKVAADTIPTRDFESKQNALLAEKEEIRAAVDQVNDADLNARFDDLGVTLKQAWPKWNQARFAGLSAAEQEAGLALRRREAAQIHRLRRDIARATATMYRENRKVSNHPRYAAVRKPEGARRGTRRVATRSAAQGGDSGESGSSDGGEGSAGREPQRLTSSGNGGAR
jgi:hypothetical protein